MSSSCTQNVILQWAYSVISGCTRSSVGEMPLISHFTPGTLLDRYATCTVSLSLNLKYQHSGSRVMY